MEGDLFDRSVWALDPNILHLNHGSFGAVPRPVRREQDRWRDSVDANPSGFYSRQLEAALDAVRDRVSRFVRADRAGLVLQPNVTWATETVLASIELGPGDEVLITDDTYAAVRRAVQQVCARSGATLVQAAIGLGDRAAGDRISAAVEHSLSPRTKLVVIDHITSPTAVLVDVASLVKRCHENGSLVFVDGAHAPGMIAVDVEQIGADFYAGNFHKWCCAPRGSAFLAVDTSWANKLRPLVHGSRSDRGFPADLEWWGTADYSAILATPHALDLLEAAGVDRLRQRNANLLHEGAALVAQVLNQAPPPAGDLSMIAVVLPTWLASDPVTAEGLQQRIASTIGAEVMVASVRGKAVLRLSAYVYNGREDFEKLAAYLEDLAK